MKQKKKPLGMRAFAMILFMALFSQIAQAQVTVNMTNGSSEVGTGGVNFYDSGGPGSGGPTRYRHNEEYTYTFTLPSLQSNMGLKVVELAELSGFHSNTSFYQAFRAVMGEPPSHWCSRVRKSVRKKTMKR